ncbi:MAG: PQQ-binding-like beta-propeller repeat protein [Phycisphaerae bacterium]|nr:PQQ-binding-like beta-propeller repeat protein [Phycisphaerae bacterium]
MRASLVLALLIGWALLAPLAHEVRADDWPTYRGDARRSGISAESLTLPMRAAWVYRPSHSPRPAWPEAPAKRDVLNRVPRLSATTTYDRAYHVAVAGDCLYYGSSADDTVYCLDVGSGEVRWCFLAEGPIRLAPALSGDRVFVGSDDGCVYCLGARTGELRWKHRAGPEDRRLPGNERIISRWPVRCGLVVEGDALSFCAGLFPLEGVYLCRLALADGATIWKRKIDVCPQGYLVASPQALFVPTGRTAPAAFASADGKPLSHLGQTGGCFAVVCEDMVAYGPNERGELSIHAPASRERIISTPGIRLVAKDGMAYLLEEGALTALDRSRYLQIGREISALVGKQKRTRQDTERLARLRQEQAPTRRWRVPCATSYDLILSGSVLFVGGRDCVVAYATEDGKAFWRGVVDGKACGLAVAGGRLFVSTDRGNIHCFVQGGGEDRSVQARETSTSVPSGSFAEGTLPPLLEGIAESVVKVAGTRKGYCLVLGAGTGRLVREVALRGDWHVVGIEPDASKAAEAKGRLRRLGLLGTRASVHHAPLSELPYPSCLANVVVSGESLIDRSCPFPPAEEVWRVVRPCGGAVVLAAQNAAVLERWGRGKVPGWTVGQGEHGSIGSARRGPLPGAGEWTHAYGEPGNSACSGDTLVGGALELQWFGPPGPRRMVDRHFRNVPPLYRDGRLFIPGDGIVYAVDAYNGAPLWQVEVPDSRRLGVFLDTSNMIVDESLLYVAARDRCHRLDVGSGRACVPFALPRVEGRESDEWGYLACAGDVLLGSGRRSGTSYQEISRAAELETHPVWYPNMRMALSEAVFGLARRTGEVLWTHASGRVVETTLTVGDGRLYFVESHSPKALTERSGRLAMRDLIAGGDQFLVALDLADGHVIHKQRLDLSRFQQPTYLSYANGVLLLSGSRIVGGEAITATGLPSLAQRKGDESIHYAFQAFDASTGRARWQATHGTNLPVRGGHGEYNRHPTLVGGMAYTWPYAYCLATGQRVEAPVFPKNRHGCGGVSGSADVLFLRDGNPAMIDPRSPAGVKRLTRITRPGCWVNILPVGGLVLIPEASSGCSCGYPIQTSIALAPTRGRSEAD